MTGLTGCIGLRLTNPASGVRAVTRFRLAADEGSWRGVAPEQIRDERNPLLRFPTAATVDVTWENGDGKRHRFVVEDSGGRTLVESAASAKRGEIRTVSFEPKQEMTTYLDPGYPVQMRGEILVTDN